MDPRFVDHFRNPRCVGDLEGATVRVRVENPACGDVVTLALALEGGRISLARVRIDGCSGAVAAASVAADRISGRTLEEARAVDAAWIDAALGGLPALKRHGADLAADAVRAALREADATRDGRGKP